METTDLGDATLKPIQEVQTSSIIKGGLATKSTQEAMNDMITQEAKNLTETITSILHPYDMNRK